MVLPPAEGQILFRRHILHFNDPHITFCGRKVQPTDTDGDRHMRGCGGCNKNLVRHREAKRKASQPPPQPPRGGSVRTVSGGLPGLGRR